jgi:general secretion pathway protein I
MGHTTVPLTESSSSRKRESIVRQQWQMGPRHRGFSLLEVLAAFVILALVGTALFRLFSGALGNAALADEYSRATLYAESRLAGIGVETPLREGVQQGASEDGYYAWTVKIEPYTPPGTTPDIDSTVTAMGVSLWRLAATVRWPGAPGSERSVALATLKVAIKEPSP